MALISYVASDPFYYSLYKQYARNFASSVFESSKVQVTYDYYCNLIRESVEKEEAGYTFLRNGISGFDAALITAEAACKSALFTCSVTLDVRYYH